MAVFFPGNSYPEFTALISLYLPVFAGVIYSIIRSVIKSFSSFSMLILYAYIIPEIINGFCCRKMLCISESSVEIRFTIVYISK
ncbi:hypothetical protein [Methanoplanus endosymbiosus]|uniref:Uncharacterized protein n=1 Tax=Methanoplanus endosymbiosus TaxID=33865 RepID=A0A9E7PLJ7_9EURY|nr:hypothetical protein [Methanoplanus endosymbiosus]UUX92378.1 hypothetical protein L6E24_13730 [Methanoplanus endosymbiosus]